MRQFAQKVWNRLRGSVANEITRSKPRQTRRRRLELETLEDRCVMDATAFGSVSGVAFIDANHNGVVAANDLPTIGVLVNLSGTTSLGAGLNLSTTTDAHGVYTFLNVDPGTYQVNIAPSQAVTATVAGGGFRNVHVNPNQAVLQDLTADGISPIGISLREFLASTVATDLPVQPLNNTPVVNAVFSSLSLPINSNSQVIDLAAHFGDPNRGDTLIMMNTNFGTIDVDLTDNATPQTVANFLDYVQSGDYDNSIYHRLAFTTDPTGVPFVLQGGGYKFQSSPSQLSLIPTRPTVQNEFKASNLQGTIAMAKVGSDPNSATDQYFFNLGNNSSNLDSQNGGFTVFGNVVGAASQATIAAMTALPRPFTSILPNTDVFFDLPFSNFTSNPLPADDTGSPVSVPLTTADNFALVNHAFVASRNDRLTYSATSTNPGLVTPVINSERMTLNFTPGASGTATISVTATDAFGSSTTTTFTVTLS